MTSSATLRINIDPLTAIVLNYRELAQCQSCNHLRFPCTILELHNGTQHATLSLCCLCLHNLGLLRLLEANDA